MLRSQTDVVEPARFVVIVDPVAHFFNYVPAARDLGLGVIVLSANRDVMQAEEAAHTRMDATYAARAHVDHIVAYQADDVASAIAALAPWRDRIAGLVAGDEVTVRMTAAIGRALGFAYASAEDADCQQIKSKMKQRLAACAVPTAPFEVVDSLEDAVNAWRALGGDCMVKMVDYAMSYGVARARSVAEVTAHWHTIERLRGELDHGFASHPQVVVETFVKGRGYSVEGYEQDGTITILNISEKLVHSNFMVVGHYIPADVSKETAHLLRSVTVQCVRALGLRRTLFHAELHVTGSTAYLIECASRPPGQYSVGVMKRIYGFDLMRASLELACGRPVHIEPTPPKVFAAILALYADRTGLVETTAPLDWLRARPECYALKCAVEVGDAVCRLETFRDILGLALLEADSPAAIRALYDDARRLDWFETQTPARRLVVGAS